MHNQPALRQMKMIKEQIPSGSHYPFTIPSIRTLDELTFTTPVTFFVGENGSGKSTVLEAIADKAGFHTAGGGRNNRYELERSEASLSPYIRLSWMPKRTDGFFLRAESFYEFASHLDTLGPDSYRFYGGKSLHEQSHGESFLSLFTNRFGGGATYLLDEPEAALSPARQLTLIKIMHDLTTREDAQFIIATHSPILLGYPGATLYSFDNSTIQPVQYEQTDHYLLTKYFVNNRQKLLTELLGTDEEE